MCHNVTTAACEAIRCFIHPAIYLRYTERKGRGVFCRENLQAGDLVETSPVIPMSAAERVHLRATLLRDYIFGWQRDEAGPQTCISLGYLSLYNHAYEANCSYEKDYETQVMSIKAVRDITANEELTINYNGTCNDASPLLWFEVE